MLPFLTVMCLAAPIPAPKSAAAVPQEARLMNDAGAPSEFVIIFKNDGSYEERYAVSDYFVGFGTWERKGRRLTMRANLPDWNQEQWSETFEWSGGKWKNVRTGKLGLVPVGKK